MFRVNKLCKVYGPYHHVIRKFSFTAQKGEVYVFLGRIGVGKTTLLRLLNHLEEADSGQLFLNEQPISFKNINRTNRIGYVLPEYNLFNHLTVEENITLVLRKVVKVSAKQATEKARKLLGRYALLGNKDEYVVSLTKEQQQRASLARVLAIDPDIVCFDDPTETIDPLLTSFIANTIQDLALQGYIVLVATRDISLVEQLHCWIQYLYRGGIIESELFKKINENDHPFITKFIDENKLRVPKPFVEEEEDDEEEEEAKKKSLSEEDDI